MRLLALRTRPLLLFALAFILAQSLDLATYLQSPDRERNLVPMLLVTSTFWVKMAAVAAVVVGAMILAARDRADAPVLQWAKAVLIVGTGVAFASFLLNSASLTGII